LNNNLDEGFSSPLSHYLQIDTSSSNVSKMRLPQQWNTRRNAHWNTFTQARQWAAKTADHEATTTGNVKATNAAMAVEMPH